jgi:hypothetical protein
LWVLARDVRNCHGSFWIIISNWQSLPVRGFCYRVGIPASLVAEYSDQEICPHRDLVTGLAGFEKLTHRRSCSGFWLIILNKEPDEGKGVPTIGVSTNWQNVNQFLKSRSPSRKWQRIGWEIWQTRIFNNPSTSIT